MKPQRDLPPEWSERMEALGFHYRGRPSARALADSPSDRRGESDRVTRIVTLDKDLTQAERRCTIAHELEHFDVPTPREPVLAARLERQIDQKVARRLIPLDRLSDALAWSHTIAEAAGELWVDEATLRVRLEHLHPSERAHLKKRLEHRHER